MANDRKQKLYDRLTAKGLKFNGIEGFDEKMKDRATAQKIYDRGVAHGLKFNDFDNWYSEFGPQKATSVTETVQPAATVTEPTNTTAAAPAAQPVPTPQPAVTEVAAAPAVEAADQTQQPVVTEEPAVAESAPQVEEHNADALTDDTPLQSWETPFDRSKFLMNRMSNADAREKMSLQYDLEQKAYDTYHDPYGLKAQQQEQFNKANDLALSQAKQRVFLEGKEDVFDKAIDSVEAAFKETYSKSVKEKTDQPWYARLGMSPGVPGTGGLSGAVSHKDIAQLMNLAAPSTIAEAAMLTPEVNGLIDDYITSKYGKGDEKEKKGEDALAEMSEAEQELARKAINKESESIANMIKQGIVDRYHKNNMSSNALSYFGTNAFMNSLVGNIEKLILSQYGTGEFFAMMDKNAKDYNPSAGLSVATELGNFAVDLPIFNIVGAGSGLLVGLAERTVLGKTIEAGLSKAAQSTARWIISRTSKNAVSRLGTDAVTRFALENSAATTFQKAVMRGASFVPKIPATIANGILTMGTFNAGSGYIAAKASGQDYGWGDIMDAYSGAALFSLFTVPGHFMESVARSGVSKAIAFGSGLAVEGGYMSYEDAARQAELNGGNWEDVDYAKAITHGYLMAAGFKAMPSKYIDKDGNERVGVIEPLKARLGRGFKPKWAGELTWNNSFNEIAKRYGYKGEFAKFMETGEIDPSFAQFTNSEEGNAYQNGFYGEYERFMSDPNIPVEAKRSAAYVVEGKVTPMGKTIDADGNVVQVMSPEQSVVKFIPGEVNGKKLLRGVDPLGCVLMERSFRNEEERSKFLSDWQGTVEANNLRYAENFAGALTEEEYEAIMAESNDLTEDEIRDKVSKAQIEKRDRLIADTKKKVGNGLEEALNKPYEKRSQEEQALVDTYMKELEHAGQTPEVRALDEATGEDGMVVFAEKNADGKEVYVVKYPENEKEVAIIDTETGEKEVVLATEITELGSESAEDVLASINETYDPAKGAKKGNVVWVKDHLGKWQETEIDSVDADGTIWFIDPVSGLKSAVDKDGLDLWQQMHDTDEFIAKQHAINAARQDELRQKQEDIKAQQQKDHDEAPFFVEVDGKMVPAAEYNEVGAGLAEVKLMDGTYLQDYVEISKVHPGDDVRASEKKEADAAAEKERKAAEEEAAKKAAEEKKATLKNIEDQLKTSVDENGVADVEAQVKKLVDDGILTPGEAKVFENQIKAKRQEIGDESYNYEDELSKMTNSTDIDNLVLDIRDTDMPEEKKRSLMELAKKKVEEIEKEIESREGQAEKRAKAGEWEIYNYISEYTQKNRFGISWRQNGLRMELMEKFGLTRDEANSYMEHDNIGHDEKDKNNGILGTVSILELAYESGDENRIAKAQKEMREVLSYKSKKDIKSFLQFRETGKGTPAEQFVTEALKERYKELGGDYDALVKENKPIAEKPKKTYNFLGNDVRNQEEHINKIKSAELKDALQEHKDAFNGLSKAGVFGGKQASKEEQAAANTRFEKAKENLKAAIKNASDEDLQAIAKMPSVGSWIGYEAEMELEGRGVNPFPNMPQGEKWTPKPDQYGIKEGDVFYDKKGNKITLSRYGDSGVGFGGIYNVFDKDGRVLSNGGVKADEIQKKLKNGTWKKANGDEPSPINKAIETFKSATDKLYKAFQKGPDAPKEVAESDKAEKELAKQMESLSDEDLLKMATATGEAKYDRPLEILVGEELKRRYWNETGFTDKNRATYDRKQLVLGNEAQKMWLYGDHIHGHGKDVADEWLRSYNELTSKPFATEKEWDDHVADVRKTEEKTPRRSKDKPNPKYPKAEGEWLAALDARAGWKNAFDAWEAETAARKEWLEIMKAMPKTDNYDELRNWFNDRYNELKSKYGENDMRALYAKSYLDNPKQTKSFLVKGEPKPEPKKPESNKELAKVEQDRYNEDMEKFKNPKALVPEGEQGWKDWIKATENLVKEREKEGNQEAAASLRGAVRAMKDRFEYMKSHGTWDGKGKWKEGKPSEETNSNNLSNLTTKELKNLYSKDYPKNRNAVTAEFLRRIREKADPNDPKTYVGRHFMSGGANMQGLVVKGVSKDGQLIVAEMNGSTHMKDYLMTPQELETIVSGPAQYGLHGYWEFTPVDYNDQTKTWPGKAKETDKLNARHQSNIGAALKEMRKGKATKVEKQNKTNGLVENEGSRKLEEATRNLLDSMGSQTGRNVEVKKLPEGVDGYYDPKTNTIYVAEDVVKVSDEAVRWTMGHETTHLLKDENPELWPRFESFVKTSMGVDKFNEKVEKLRKKYQEAINDPDITEEMREALRMYTDADYREEVLANWAGDHALVDKKFAEKLIKDAEEIGTDVPGLIKKFIASIERMITNIKKAIMGKPNADEIERLKSLENAKKIWSQMYDVAVAKHNAAVEQANNGETLGKKRMSLRDLERDGNPDDPEWLKRNGLELRDAYKLMRLTDDKKLQTLYIGRETYDIPNWYNADSPDLSMFDNLEQDYFYLFDDNNNVIDKKPIKYGKNYNIGGLTKKEILDANDNGFRWMTVARYADGSRKIGNMGINGGKDESPSWYAIRPGIHAGSEPSMQQIASGSKEEKAAMGGYRDDNLVWVKGKVLVGLNEEEMAELNAKGEIQSHIPSGGYIKGTSSFVTKGMDWFITNAFKPEKIISDREAMAEIDRANADPELTEKIPYDHPRRNGRLFNAETMELEEPIRSEKVEIFDATSNSKTPSVATTENGQPIAARTSNGVLKFSLYNREDIQKGRKKLLESNIEKGILTKKMAEDIEHEMSFIEDNMNESISMEEFAAKYPEFVSWNNLAPMRDFRGKKYLSWVKGNQEYPYNIDPSASCVKRDDFNSVLNDLFGNGKIDVMGLDRKDYAVLREILRNYGLQLSCEGCYVDNTRSRMFEWADEVSSVWNQLIDAAVGKGNATKFSNKRETFDGKFDSKALDKKVNELTKANNIGAYADIAKLLKSNMDLVHYADANDLVSPEKYAQVYMAANPDADTALRNIKRQGTPKMIVPDAVYEGDIQKRWTSDDAIDKAFEAGGVRIQSNSDFRNTLFVDYCQLFADLASKGMPAHAYTKVTAFVKLFGMTGAKINMSLFPAVEGVTPEKRARFNAMGEDKYNDPEFKALSERAGLSETDADGLMLSDESFNKEDAWQIVQDPRYAKNCGTIMVVVSDAHYWKCADDPRIKLMIPFHSNNEPEATKEKDNTDFFTIYNYHQNTCKPSNGFEMKDGESYQDYYARLNTKNEGTNTKTQYGTKAAMVAHIDDFNYYDDLKQTKDPVLTAQHYVEVCQKKGLIPIFPEFVYYPKGHAKEGQFNPRYAELIGDFSLRDEKGNYAPQEAVKFDTDHMPENWKDILLDGLETEHGKAKKLDDNIDKACSDFINYIEEKKAKGNGKGRMRLSYGKWFQTEENNSADVDKMISKATDKLNKLDKLDKKEVWELVRDLGYINHSAFKVRPGMWDKYPDEMLNETDLALNKKVYNFKKDAVVKLIDLYKKNGWDVTTDDKRTIAIFRDPSTGIRQITFHTGKDKDIIEGITNETGSFDGVTQAHHYSDDASYLEARRVNKIKPSKVASEQVEYAINISDKESPFTEEILDGTKKYETRDNERLSPLLNKRVAIMKTGGSKGDRKVVGYVTVGKPKVWNSKEEWDADRALHQVPEGSKYDWKPETKVKYGYEMLDPKREEKPYTPEFNISHGTYTKAHRTNEGLRFSLGNYKDDKTLVGIHNITETKLRNALKQGGLANPSTAVIDTDKTAWTDYGEISLIMPSSLVDRKTGKNAGTFDRDMWSPMYPKVEYNPNKVSDKNIENALSDIRDTGLASEIRRDFINYANGNSRGDGLKYLFLKSLGKEPEIAVKKPTSISIETIRDFFGKEDVSYDDYKNLPEDKKTLFNALCLTGGDYEAADKFVNSGQAFIRNMAKQEMDLSEFDFKYESALRNSREKGKPDYPATFRNVNEILSNENLYDECESWMNNLISGLGFDEEFEAGFNERTGNRIYKKNTLANVSAYMKKQGLVKSKDHFGLTASSILGAIAKRIGSLEDIRNNKGRLSADIQEWRALESRIMDAANIFYRDSQDMFMANQSALGYIEDIVAGKDIDRIVAEFNQYNPNSKISLTPEERRELQSIAEDAKTVKVPFFETKFERPVGFEEFKAAVVPNKISSDLIKALQDKGIQVHTYDPEISGDRERVQAEASKQEGIRFSLGSAPRSNGTERKPNESYKEYAQRLLDMYENSKPGSRDENGKLVRRKGESYKSFASRILADYEASKNQNPDDDPTTPNGGGKGRMRLSYGNSKERDKEYADAVKSGDEETARNMVREAAKSAIPDTKVVDENGSLLEMYHGSAKGGGFTVFDKNKIGSSGAGRYEGLGFNFTSSDARASSYSNGSKPYSVYLDIKNPLSDKTKSISYNEFEKIFRDIEKAAGENSLVAEYGYYPVTEKAIRQLARQIYDYAESDADLNAQCAVPYSGDANAFHKVWQSRGYDGVVWHDKYSGKISTAIAFDSEQIKSADPITYDNDGNVIPLSERFNKDKKDIRFSLGSAPRSAEMDAREADLDFKAEEKFNDVKTAYTDMMARQAGRLDTPEGIKDAARDITEFIQANINSFVADELGSMRIKSLITQIRRATTRQELEAPVKKAEQILNDAEIIATQKRLDKTMDAVLQKKNDRGVLVENRVHNTMREVFEGVRKTYDNPSLTSTASDMLIKKTSKEASALRGRIAALKAGTPKPEDAGHVGDAAWMANLDAKLKAKESEVRQNVQDRVDALNKAIEKELNDIDALRTKTDDDIADKISAGEAPGEDLVFQKVVTIPLKEAAVEVRNAYTDMESIKAQWQEELAILNGIRRAPGYKARKTAQAAKVAALEEAYMQAQEKVIKAAGMFNENMKYILSMGHEMLKDKMKAEVEHKKMIINSALGDVKHSKVRLEGERTGVARGIRNGLQKLDDYATIPLWSADFALQMADQNHRNGEGFLYKYYMKDPDHGLVAANDNMYKGRKAFGDALNNKVTEIFGIKESLLTGRSSFAELRQRAQEDLGVPIERTLTTDEAKKLTHNTGGRVIDQTEADLLNAIGYGDRDDWQAGDMRPWEKGDPYTVEHMTKAHALYLWLTWRQADGKMKMANMGYTDEAIDAIEKALGPEYIKLGEWMTEEFLPQLWQEKYLPRYKELYGTTIPITKKYFPLKIDKDSIRQTGGIDQMSKQFMVSTVTPALIQRTRNTAKIDPDADAFDVIQQYGNLMEQWHAMAPIIKDINTLHQSFAVKECMNANHEGSFNTLMKAFQVATGSLYDTDQSKNMRMLNEAIGKTISTGARAAIGFRVNTALKQMLSYPAFYAYRGDAQFYAELTANNPLLGIGLATAMFRGNKRTIGWRGTHEWALEHLPAYRQRVGEGDMGLEGMNDETWSDDAFIRQLSKMGMKANRFVDTMTIAAGARAVYNCAMRKAKKMGMSSEEAERFAVIEAEIAYNQSQQSSRPEFSSEAQKNGGSLVRSLLMFRNAAIGYTRQVRLSAHDMSKALRMCQQNGASETAKIMGAAAWTMATFGAMLPMYWYMGGHTNQMYQALSGNGMDDDDEKGLWNSIATGMLTDGTTFGAPIAAWVNKYGFKITPALDDFYDTFINDRKTLTAQTAMQYALQYGIGLNLETMDNIMAGLDEIYASATDAPDANLLIGVLLLINNPKSDRRGWARQMYAQYGPVEYAKAWNMASQVQQSEKRANDRVEETIERRDEDFYKAMQQIKDLEKTFNKATKEEQKAILESDEYKTLQPIFDKGIWDTYSALIVPAMRANARKLNAEGVNFKKGGHGTLMQGASDETLMKELDKLIKQWKDLQNK